MEVATTIIPGQRYVVWGAQIIYNSLILNIGDEFYGVDGVSSYSGDGNASEILNLQSASLEAYVQEDIIFPEKLELVSASIEIEQPSNGTIYPEQLSMSCASIEISDSIINGAIIIESVN